MHKCIGFVDWLQEGDVWLESVLRLIAEQHCFTGGYGLGPLGFRISGLEFLAFEPRVYTAYGVWHRASGGVTRF